MNVLLRQLSVRQIHLFIFLSIGGIIGYAAYSVQVLGLETCPLCITQQFFYCLIGISAFAAFLHNPHAKVYRVYAAIIFASSAFGVWISGRQVWLQSLPEDEVPLCGPSLEYILEMFPFGELLNALFMGDGNCAEIPWTFFGGSMALWSLLFFITFFVLSFIVMMRSNSIYR